MNRERGQAGRTGTTDTRRSGDADAAHVAPQGESERTRRIDAQIVSQAFGETANPDDYVARPACEECLGRLERVLFDLCEPAVLLAPPGMGKSLLLRVLARRTAPRARAIELAYGALAFEDLCEWIVRLAGERVTGLASMDLRHLVTRETLLVTIDDAASLPERTATALGAFARARPGLRVALADADGPETERMLEAFGTIVHRVHLSLPMDFEEACTYMTRRLERWGASRTLLDRLRTDGAERVHDLTEGVPRRIHSVAPDLLLDPGSDADDA